MRRFPVFTFVVVAVLICPIAITVAEPVGSVFTYQGRLKEAGQPFNGSADVTFRLFDAEVGGAQIGVDVALIALVIVDGLLTLDLDFGPDVFMGADRWIEIQVNTTVLAPRQPVTPAPYALFAFAGNEGPPGPAGAPGDSHWLLNGTSTYYTAGDVGIGTDAPSEALHVGGGNFLADRGGSPFSVTRSLTLGGARGFENVDYARIDFQNYDTDDGAVDYLGASIVSFNSGSGSDNGDLRFYTAESGSLTERMRIDETGHVGIGLQTPSYPLEVRTGGNRAIHAQSISPSGRGVFGIATAATGATQGVSGWSSSTSGQGVQGVAAATTGTNFGVSGESASTSGRGVFGLATATSGTNYGVYGKTNSGTGYAGYFEGGRNYFEGHVGIGTTSPLYPIHVDTSASRGVFATTSGFYGVYGVASASTSGIRYGSFFRSNGTDGRGVFGWTPAASGTTSGVYGQSESTTGRGVFGIATATSGTNYGVYGQTDSLSGRGVYGLATAVFDARTYGVYGQTDSSNSGAGVFGIATANGGTTVGVEGHNSSFEGTGVSGNAVAATGRTVGVKGSSRSTAGKGVSGLAQDAIGLTVGV